MPRTAFAARGICGFGLCGRAAWEPLHRFQSTRPVWDATRAATASSASPSNFNPRAPCGARPDDAEMRRYIEKFQSTRHVWGATLPQPLKAFIVEISIHAPRVGRDCAATITRCWRQISIHAPRVGRDQELTPDAHRTSISIHAPRVGRDCILSIRKTLLSYFNPRAPCGTRRALVILVDCALQISIHAPRVGRDLASSAGAIVPERFQSTRPVWGATAPPSILAP